MGAIKEWALSHAGCSVCGKCFLPWETKHRMNDLRLPTCSQQCEDELKQIFNAIADSKENEDEQRE